MPRLSPSFLRNAAKLNPHLPPLLRICRDLRSAQNELRWLRDHAIDVAKLRASQHEGIARDGKIESWRTILDGLVKERSRGVPLQYLLGTEFFGDLELEVRRGVLVPRQETASITSHLVNLLLKNREKNRTRSESSTTGSPTSLPPTLRILDFCTGTGCIPLLFWYEFRKGQEKFLRRKQQQAAKRGEPNHEQSIDLQLVGVDISPQAVPLARRNFERVKKQLEEEEYIPQNSSREIGDEVSFIQGNILSSTTTPTNTRSTAIPYLHQALSTTAATASPKFDILTSNPPYISPQTFHSPTVSHPVRRFEPKLALVPPPLPQNPNLPLSSSAATTASTTKETDAQQADSFYPALLSHAQTLSVKICMFEIGDLEQARRVARLVKESGVWDGVQIWRDEPGLTADDGVEEVDGTTVLGRGNIRAVVCWRGKGGEWLGTHDT